MDMVVTELKCRNFRNLREVLLTPCEEVNIIYGENAQGKTNLAEAIWLFCGMKSFRGAKDAELINHGADFAKLELKFRNSARENRAELTVANKRSAALNGVKLPGAPALIGKFSAVVFAPSFLSIIENGPAERRRFLDTAVCQLKPSFAGVAAEYARLLKQRNSLLRDIAVESSLIDLLDVLDEKLCRTGEAVTAARKAYLEKLAPAAEEIYAGLSGGREAIGFRYVGRYGDNMAAALKSARREDFFNKTTSVGPHRDDIEITLNGLPVRVYGSQGQKRSCAVAMKLTEAELLRENSGEQPVILLDDVMSELDAMRQDYILNPLKNRQVFINCCEPGTLLRSTGGKPFRVMEGEVFEN